MPIEGFDHVQFAQNLAQQAAEMVPQEFSDNEKQYVVNTLLNLASMAGEAFSSDPENNFNLDQVIMMTQIIAEWSFHKSVDLIRAKIPQEFWDDIMRKIAFTIFEVEKNAFLQGLPQDQILQLVEHHVKKVYLESLADLNKQGHIDKALMEIASTQSNIDAMAAQQQAQEMASEDNTAQTAGEKRPQTADINGIEDASDTPKLLKLATVALLFRKMQQDKVQVFLNKFNPEDAKTVIKYMGIPDLEDKVSVNKTMKCLRQIKTNLPTGEVIGPARLVKIIQKITQNTDRQKLETLLNGERLNVKRFIFNALDGEYYHIPPKVANIIATHVKDIV